MGFWAAAIPAAASLAGGLLGKKGAEKSTQKNIDWQRELNKNQMQWRTEDAKKAGLHPMAALGMSGASSSPVAVGGNELGRGIAEAGQAIGGQMSSKINEATLEGLQLDNENKRLQNDIVRQSAKASNNARSMQEANSQQDVVNPGTTATYINPEAGAESAQQEVGEILGEIHAIRRAGRNTVRHYHGEKEDRKRAGWMIDKRTGRVARNPNYRRSKKTRRGRRYY